MKISIIIVTYNRERLLKKCLDSLISQNYIKSDYQIIIVNNSSTDNTNEILKSYENNNNLKIINMKKNFGPGIGRNIGLKNADYGIIAMIDDDCVPNHTWLSSIKKHFKTDVDIMIGRLENYDVKIIVGESHIYRYKKSLKKGLKKIGNRYYADMFSTGNCALRKSVLKKVGYFWKYPYGEDRDMKYRMQDHGYKIMYNPEMIVKHVFTDSIIKNFRKDLRYGRYEYYFRKKWEKRFYKIGGKMYTANIKPLICHETFNDLIKRCGFKGLRMYLRFFYSHLASSSGFYYEKYVNTKIFNRRLK